MSDPRKRIPAILLPLLALAVASQTPLHRVAAAEPRPLEIPESSYRWWREARFGVFIHWNASSVLRLGEGSWSRKNPTDQGHDYHKRGDNRMEKIPPAVITDGSYKKWMGKGGVPMEVYDNLYHVFNPSQFNAEEWVKTFKDAGAGYIVFTTKHHDGFCMFDSRFTEYKITSTPFKQDNHDQQADPPYSGYRAFWKEAARWPEMYNFV